jgi:DNA-directed RNA polymerase specialized sigma24 family protein
MVSSPNPKHKKLDSAVLQMLRPDPDEPYPPILTTIRGRLKQSNVSSIYEPEEIFGECYRRAVLKIDSGEEIPNIFAWFRTTASYVVFEWSRLEYRQQATTERLSVDLSGYSVDADLEVLDRIDILDNLKPVERALLVLRASGKTWDEIAQQLVAEELEEELLNSNTLAQRYHRLIKRLGDLE